MPILDYPRQGTGLFRRDRGQNVGRRDAHHPDPSGDLNPIRARLSETLEGSDHTSIQKRIPEDACFLSARLRRNKTDALDSLISGTIWLDEISLEILSREVQ